MANKKVTDLTAITTAPVNGVIHFIDTNDVTQNAAGSSFKVTKEDFLKENTAAILLNTAKVGITTDQSNLIAQTAADLPTYAKTTEVVDYFNTKSNIGFPAYDSTSSLKSVGLTHTLKISGTFNFFHLKIGDNFYRYRLPNGTYDISGNNQILGFYYEGVTIDTNVTIVKIAKTTISPSNFVVLCSTGTNGILTGSVNSPITEEIDGREYYASLTGAVVSGTNVIISGLFNFIYRREYGVWIRYRLTAGTYSLSITNRVLAVNFFNVVPDAYITPTVEVANNYTAKESLILFASNADGNVFGVNINIVPGNKVSIPSGNIEKFQVEVNTGRYNYDTNTVSIKDSEVLYNDNAAVLIPASYTSSGKPTRLIIYAHGAGNKVGPVNTDLGKVIFQYLSNKGFAILEVNGLPIEIVETGEDPSACANMGGQIGVSSYQEAYRYVIDKYNIYTDGVILYGQSMGGLMSSNLLNNSNIPVLAHVLTAGIVDLFNQAYLNPFFGGSKGTIYQTAKYNNFRNYQTFNPTSLTAQQRIDYFNANLDRVAGFNPINTKTTDVSGVKYTQWKCPLLMIHSVYDNVVLPAKNIELKDNIKRSGGICEIRLIDDGNTYSNQHAPIEIGTIVETINGISVTSTMKELYLFITRFC